MLDAYSHWREFRARLVSSYTEAEILPEFWFQVTRLVSGGRVALAGPPDLRALQELPSGYGIPILFPPNRVREAAFTPVPGSQLS